MSEEWQTAMFVRVHKRYGSLGPLKNGQLVHIRKIDANNPRLAPRFDDCDGTEAFAIQETGRWTCEHEVLTD